MTALEIGITVGACVLVIFTVVFNIVRRKKGKPSCGCSEDKKSEKGGCSGCQYSAYCNKSVEEKEKDGD